MTDRHVTSVCDKLTQRAEVGLRKYGVTTERTDLTDLDWIRHAQEEVMDLAVYLETIIQRLSSSPAANLERAAGTAQGEDTQ